MMLRMLDHDWLLVVFLLGRSLARKVRYLRK